MDCGLERAFAELKDILDSQWNYGMRPQIRFAAGESGCSPGREIWQASTDLYLTNIFETSGITQPLLIGRMMGGCRRHRDGQLLRQMVTLFTSEFDSCL